MKPINLTPSQVAAITSASRLIAISDAIARARNTVAMLADHDAILNDSSNCCAGIWQTLNQLESDLSVIASDLASAAVEARVSIARPMASRVQS